MSNRHRRIAYPVALALVLASAAAASPVMATGTCRGNATEYPLPTETQDPSLTAYDVNGDGVICVASKGHRTVYSDNRI